MTETRTPNTDSATRGAPSDIPPFDYVTVLPIAVVAMIAAFFSASRYHLFGDELYFIAAGHHLSVSYADQGPILPLLALLGDVLPGDSLIVFRLPSLIVTLAGILIAALIAREFGGGRLAQALTAGAYATSTFLLLQSSLLATNAIDTPLWVAITWLVVRWVRTRKDWLLFAAGVLTAVDMQVKWLIPVFWVCVIVASLLWGPRDLIRRPALWVGGLFTVATMVPALIWQAQRGWPYLQLTDQVAAESQYAGGRLLFVPILFLTAGVLGSLLLIGGLVALMRSPRLRPYRFLAPAFVLLVIVFLITAGRPYYPGGMITVIVAAGAVAFERIRWPWVHWVAAPVAVLAALSMVVSLPFKPESEIDEPASLMEAGMQISVYGQFGWPELTRAVRESIDGLPESERPQAIVASSYWQAGALQYYGGDALPPVFSPNRGFGYFGEPADSATTVLWIVASDAEPNDMCAQSRTLRPVHHRIGMPTASTDVDIRLCTVTTPWSQQWSGLRRM